MVLDATGPNFKPVARVHKKWGFFSYSFGNLMESFKPLRKKFQNGAKLSELWKYEKVMNETFLVIFVHCDVSYPYECGSNLFLWSP